MAMAPKKKYEFFGRFANDSRSNSPRSPSCDASPSDGSTRHSSPFQVPQSPPLLDYPAAGLSPTMVSPPVQPIYAATPLHPHDYHSPISVAAQYPPTMLPQLPSPSYGRPYVGFRPQEPHAHEETEGVNGELSTPCYTIKDDGEETQCGYLGQKKSPSHGSDSGYGGSKSQKRPQRCRMCANHGLKVDMKGHKWYCPHRDCPCEDCDITRKTQYYMKERQKLTRHQQQQLTDDRGNLGRPQSCGEYSGGDVSNHGLRTNDQGQEMDFPRVQEMVNQTENILDYDLFEKVNQACRPRSSNRQN